MTVLSICWFPDVVEDVVVAGGCDRVGFSNMSILENNFIGESEDRTCVIGKAMFCHQMTFNVNNEADTHNCLLALSTATCNSKCYSLIYDCSDDLIRMRFIFNFAIEVPNYSIQQQILAALRSKRPMQMITQLNPCQNFNETILIN